MRILNNPYVSTDASAAAHVRGTAYTLQGVALTNETRTIDQSRIVPLFIDRADLAQCTFLDQMNMAEKQAILLHEHLETDMLANHAMWTDFDNSDVVSGGSGNITVSTSNVDDIIRAVKTKVRKANGQAIADRYGIFIIWRAEDFEKLEAFVQANGFQTADHALKNGILAGFYYGGVSHYISNSHAAVSGGAQHLFAGVKRQMSLGILKATYGQITINQDPSGVASGGGTNNLSGISVVGRLDYEFATWANSKVCLYDINVVG